METREGMREALEPQINKDCIMFVERVITPACERIAPNAVEFNKLYEMLEKHLAQDGTGYQRLFEAIWDWQGHMAAALRGAQMSSKRKYNVLLNMVELLESCQADCNENRDINARCLGVRIQMTKYSLIDTCAEFIPCASQAELSPIDLIPSRGWKCIFFGEADFRMSVALEETFAPHLGGGMIFTEFRPEDEIMQTYSGYEANRAKLQDAGIFPHFMVDATLGPAAVAKYVEKAVFMFPHMPGEHRGSTGNMLALLASFLFSCMEQLPLHGQVYIAIAGPYYNNRWLHPVFDRNPKLQQCFELRYIAFQPDMFPGYEHRQTAEDKSAPSTQKSTGIAAVFTLCRKPLDAKGDSV